MVSRSHSNDWSSESINFKVDLLWEECVMTCGLGVARPLLVNEKHEERMHNSSQDVKD